MPKESALTVRELRYIDNYHSHDSGSCLLLYIIKCYPKKVICKILNGAKYDSLK